MPTPPVTLPPPLLNLPSPFTGSSLPLQLSAITEEQIRCFASAAGKPTTLALAPKMLELILSALDDDLRSLPTGLQQYISTMTDIAQMYESESTSDVEAECCQDEDWVRDKMRPIVSKLTGLLNRLCPAVQSRQVGQLMKSWSNQTIS